MAAMYAWIATTQSTLKKASADLGIDIRIIRKERAVGMKLERDHVGLLSHDPFTSRAHRLPYRSLQA